MNIPAETGTDDVQAHPRHTGHHRFDLVMAICAIFISAVSLAVAIEHGRTERQLVSASNWPFLRAVVTNSLGAGGDVAFGLSNGGVGPAKIKSYEVQLDGQPVASPGDLLMRCCGLARDPEGVKRMLPHGAASMSKIDGTVLRPGEDNEALTISRSRSDRAMFAKLDAALLRLSFKVCYCSVLDQCWTTELKDTETQSVAACPAPDHPYRYNDYLTPAAAPPRS